MRTRKIRVRHTNRKLRSDSRTLPQWGSDERGDGEDHGKWFECWNCGWLCNVDRDELGGPESKSNITLESFVVVDEYGNETTGYGADTATGILYKPVVNTGCPFCGTLNWRGDHK
jgi:hypothetical protein